MEFQCVACNYQLTNEEDKINHYRSEWHGYNVKRKCAGLMPIPKEAFREFLRKQSQAAVQEQVVYYCAICKKTLKSRGAADDHLNTNKHKKLAAKAPPELLENPIRVRTTSAERMSAPTMGTSVPIPLKSCLFCPVQCQSLQKCLTHMSAAHGFTVPYTGRLTSLEGLLLHAGKLIGEEYTCIYCFKTMKSRESVWGHMKTMGHCSLGMEDQKGAGEFRKFFNWESPQSVSTDGVSLNVWKPARHPTDVVLGDLELSDGTIIRNRDMWRYDKQKYSNPLNPNPGQNKPKQLLAIGGPGFVGGLEKKVVKSVDKSKTRAFKSTVNTERSNNSTMMHHYRPQSWGDFGI